MDSLPKTISVREKGAALIIVLAFVVLLAALGVAYISRATSDRQVAHSSFNQTKVDELAAAVTNYIVNDLFQEIVSGSNATTVNNVTVYSPTTAANMLPRRSGNPGGNPDPIANLVRRSWTGDTTLNEASAVNSFTDHSANDRYVTPARWNKHYLIPQANLGNFTAPDWAILTRNGRAQFLTWNATLKDASPSNLSYAVGRYAYAIYDEGGLLDANVAGYPSNLTANQYGPKGTSAFADLTPLGMSAGGINSVVGWRNYGSAQPGGTFPNLTFTTTAQANSYVSAVLSNTNGFLSVGTTPPPQNGNFGTRTDQMFPNRQTLIQLCLATGGPFPTDALQYLGTFLRELNAPSWAPTLNASDMGGNNGGGTYAYATNANASTSINPNLLNVRVCAANGCGFTRADGTTANPGDPLINRRFPLTRLAGLSPTGIVATDSNGNPLYSTILNGAPSVATAATIQRDFGLSYDKTGTPPNNRWNYVGASNPPTVQLAIERLDQVAAENREPNFFELLKAAILSGSVGIGTNGNTFVTAEGKYYDTTNNLSSDYQIMQIGANIISQWDSSSPPTPTFIAFGSQPYELAGIKNLPYLNKLVFKPYWKKNTGGGPPTYHFDAWLLPSLWNPHQNAGSATGNFRVAMTAGTLTAATVSPPLACSTITGGSGTQYMTVASSTFSTSPSGVTAVVNKAGAVDNLGPDPNPGPYYGFHVTSTSDATIGPSSSTQAYSDFGSSPGCTFEMQVAVTSTAGTNWKAYQRWVGCGPGHPLICQGAPDWTAKTIQDPEFIVLDPRTVRFGVWGNDGSHSGTAGDYTNGTQYTLDSTVNPPALPVELITALPPQGTSWFTLGTPSPYYLYQYANNNNTGSTAHYIDLDQVQRLGDFPTAGNASDPSNDELQPSLSATRPLALNGAFQNGIFQSVAELGHVFRDQPWKTLTFTSAMPTNSSTSARSADTGLLDVFTLHESALEAGKTSLNSRQNPVLKAILSQATKQLTGANVLDNTTERDPVVDALFALTQAQPMVNKAELVTGRMDGNGNYIAGLAANSAVTSLGNKEARECIVRAFSDACQTRTWNLLIDLIVQSGRYPPNASSLAGFVVEGETHYWVHVAIDRFTGQVIDKQIEVVTE